MVVAAALLVLSEVPREYSGAHELSNTRSAAWGAGRNVSDRTYFRETLNTGRVALSPAVFSRLRPGAPVVAISVPILPPEGGSQPHGTLVGTLSLAGLRQHMQAVLPDPGLRVVLLDRDGQVLVAPGVDFDAIRELVSLRQRPDAAAALSGESGSLVVMASDGDSTDQTLGMVGALTGTSRAAPERLVVNGSSSATRQFLATAGPYWWSKQRSWRLGLHGTRHSLP